MTIGNQNITQENMPSYVSPEQQPYHRYQSMQDLLNQGLTVSVAQPNGGNVNEG